MLKIYQKRKAGVKNGKFDKKSSIVLRTKMTMTEDAAEAANQGYKNSGVYYQLDEKATEKYDALREAKVEETKKE